MDISISPRLLVGRLAAIPSKSDAHRLLIAAALADKPTEIVLSSFSDDIRATARVIAALGAGVEFTGSGITVTPAAGVSDALLDCGESGTTARLMLPVAAVLAKRATLAGSGRLPQRPFEPLCRTLREQGCVVEGDSIPITVSGAPDAGDFRLPGNVSSQYISGLLFALPLLEGDSTVTLTTPLESAGYVNMTTDVLARFGVNVTRTENGYSVLGGQKYISPGRCAAEGDWSNAAVWLCAGALGGDVTVTGLSPDSKQGDRAVCDILQAFGARCRYEGGVVRVNGGELYGTQIDASQIPDLVPALAAVAVFAQGRTVISGASRLRLKESDRLECVARSLNALGAKVMTTADGLIIDGCRYVSGGTAEGENDHRIVMAAALAACRCEREVRITGAQASYKSYPGFFNDYNKLGGAANVINDGE